MSTRFAPRLTILAIAPFMLAALYPTEAPAQTGDEAASIAEVAQLEKRAEDVVAVMLGNQSAEEVFSSSFLQDVPPEQLVALKTQMTAQFGQIVGVESVTPVAANAARISIRFERAIASGSMQLQSKAPHRIIGLLLNDFQPVDDSAEKVRDELSALPGEVSVHFAPLDDNSAPVLSLNPERQMAIGSTFKLYVLSALARSVAAGEREWSDVVTLDRASFPSGQLQDWPAGAPVTLHTLASLMISNSDNTATDQLIGALGREAVETELLASGHSAPDRMLPFLDTLELFALKGDADLGARYAAASEAEQAAILATLDQHLGGDPANAIAPQFSSPMMIDSLEWFANAADLRGVMRRLTTPQDDTARRIMAIDDAMPDRLRDQWDYAGFKGGSEPGVLHLAWLLRGKDGRYYSLIMAWNNPAAPVDQSIFEGLSRRVLSLVS